MSKGYYRNPEADKAAFDSEGFFNTGDLGRIDPLTGCLFITGLSHSLTPSLSHVSLLPSLPPSLPPSGPEVSKKMGRLTGWLLMTGRAKDTIVLMNGENVEPEPLEEALVESPLISQAMLVGQVRPTLCT